MAAAPDDADPGSPSSYQRWVTAGELLRQRNPEAAATILHTLRIEEPGSAAVLEALARALFDARRYTEAADAFAALVAQAPDDDYALFGLGMSLWRLRRFTEAVEPLTMATVMRPDRPEYARALSQVRATVSARQAARLDPDPPGPAPGAAP